MTAADGSPEDRESGVSDEANDAGKPADGGRKDDGTATPSLQDLAKAGAISADFMEILQQMRNEDAAAAPADPEDGNTPSTPSGDAGAPDETPKD